MIQVGEITREPGVDPASGLGLFVREANALLQQIQSVILNEQTDEFVRVAAGCLACGRPLGIKDTSRPSIGRACVIVESFANDRLEDNLNPVGRIFYSASTFICTPASRSQEVGLCLGAQAGEKRLQNVIADGGFWRCRRAAETPFNVVFEARP